ncbi:DEAD/DEAH box helicase [Actinoplanes rectilineatus]|uniref:DEAD/DEAH box helicase n=1 Tax=Actinoplanes rectilineatus TaxID=113571 RepID=UPI0005F27A71
MTDNEQALVPVTSRAPVRPDSPTFADLGVRAETVEALAQAGITHAFAIQEYTLPIALRGTDLIGQAPTGTGKTLGFGLPLLERVLAPSEGADGQPQALIVVPTRELGIQVARDLAAAGSTRGVRVLAIYGGVAYEPQVDTLKKGVEILVGTPGRLLDLAKQKQLKLGSVRALVLDEADRMLDLGFLEDVEKILAMLPAQRQTMLFSATMPDPIVALSRRFLRNPMTIHAGHTTESAASPLTKQVVYRTHPLNKLEMVARILQAHGRSLTMIFTRTKRAADRVAEDLDFRGFAVAAVHGDLGQGARERALRAFRSGKIDVLVATDVAARGLDVSGVTHVINYDCPEDPETYTHRIGRTGRAGATGVAVTFVDWEDMPRWVLIDKSLGLSMPEPPETYHTSAALYADLDIPTDISGTLPTAERSRAGLSAEVEEDLGTVGRRRDGGRNSRTRSGGRPPRAGSAPAETPAAEVETSDRPKRQRRRRRVVEDEAAVTGTPAATPATAPETPAVTPPAEAPTGATDTAGAPAGATGTAAAATETAAPRTRTRRRRSAATTMLFSDVTEGGDTAPAPAEKATETITEKAENAPATVTEKAEKAPATVTEKVEKAAGTVVEKAEKPARAARRTAAKAAEKVVEAAEKVVEAVAGTPAEGESPAPRRRRRTRSTAEAADTAEAGATEA